ncbi:MAG: hypothetical protein JWO44_213 [Bacteroidetes bacterium]|nr:hypothetical protein [Bacteroidota bacterium]
METNNDIDDLFKGIIEPYEMNHSDKVWDSLDSQLEKKSNGHDKAVIFRLRIALASLSLLFGLFAAYYFFNSLEKEKKSVIISLEKAGQNKNSGISDQNTSATNYKSTEEESSKQVSEKTKTDTHETGFKKGENQKKASFPDPLFSKTFVNASGSNKPNSLRADKEENKTNENNAANGDTAMLIITDSANEDAIINAIGKDQIDKSKANTNISGTNLIIAGSIDTNEVIKTISPVAQLNKVKMDSIAADHSKKRYSLIAFFSPDLTFKYIKDNDSNDNQQEGDYNNEVSGFSYNAGLLIGYDLNRNWSLTTGGTYACLTQTIKSKVIYAEAGTDGLTHYQFNTSYGTSELPGEQSPPAIGDSLDINSNSTQSIQVVVIPLISKYQITKNKFSYYVQLGLSANILAGEKLIVETPDKRQTIRKMEGLNEYYLGGIVGVGMSYNPSGKFTVLLEPTIRGAITPISKNAAITTHPVSFGISVGVGWHF